MAHVRVGSYRVKLPRTKAGRRVLGGSLVAGGVLSFLPVLGLWMLPVGLVVLSHDSAGVRRFRRVSEVRVIRWWRSRGQAGPIDTRKEKGPGEPGPKFG
jgi:hypothetical protein